MKKLMIWITLVFISCSVLVKTTIWYSSSTRKDEKNKVIYSMGIFESTPRVKYKYTTKLKQKLFYAADNLLTPIFILFFAAMAVRLAKTPKVLEIED